MADFTTNITADGTSLLVKLKRRVQADYIGATVYIYGTFGGGTVALNLSPDNGTTLFPVTDESGTAIQATANEAVNIRHFGDADHLGRDPELYAVVTGSTAPNINIVTYTNV